jgi:putative ABC transport system permease protein
VNIASLQVAVALSRRQEMAFRAAVGASAGRLARQMLTESALLAILAGGLGVAFAYSSLDALKSFLPSNLRLADSIALDRGVLVFASCITAAAAVFSGLIPALAAARGAAVETMRTGGVGAGTRHQRRLHGMLVIAEVTAATVLLAAACQLVRGFLGLAWADPGFSDRGVLTLKIAPSPRRYPQAASRNAFYQRLIERARAIPGVELAAIGGGLPLIGTLFAAGISFQDRPEPPIGGRPSVPVAFVSADYFRALGIPIVQGRAFRESDTAEAPRAAIVNRAFAVRYFPGESPLGKRIEFGSREGLWHEIVGVAGNVRQQRRRAVDPYIVYGTLPNSFESETFLILKSELPPDRLVAAATKTVRSLDPEEPVFDVASMESRLTESLSGPRSSMALMSLLAGLALLLASIGVFGSIAYLVRRNLREIGIRMALGATPGRVTRGAVARGMSLVAAGVSLGCVGALAMARAIQSRLPEMQAADFSSVLAAAAVFLLAGAVACFIPARWAARVDPASVLRVG